MRLVKFKPPQDGRNASDFCRVGLKPHALVTRNTFATRGSQVTHPTRLARQDRTAQIAEAKIVDQGLMMKTLLLDRSL